MVKPKADDLIFCRLIPKIIDTAPELFLDKKQYMEYSEKQLQEFFEKLPESYKQNLIEEQIDEDIKSFYSEEPYKILIAFSPTYLLTFSKYGDIFCPEFQLAFKTITEDSTQTILQAAIEQFFLKQGEENGSLHVRELKDEQIIRIGLKLLNNYLPEGTKIESRHNYDFGHHKSCYELLRE